MAQDLEQFLREVFGDSISRLNQLQSGGMAKHNAKHQEIVHEAMREDLGKLATELAELRERVAVLESERAQKAVEGIEGTS